MIELKKGMVVITQGNKRSLISWGIRLATGSWWTHGFVVVSETEGIEAKPPRVTKLNLKERLAQLDKEKRDYIVMDLPGITDEEREKVALQALSYDRTLYDIWNAVYYGLFKVWVEGGRRLVCSGLMAKPFSHGIQRPIFTETSMSRLPESLKHRKGNLVDDYCTPDEVLRYSDLVNVHHQKN